MDTNNKSLALEISIAQYEQLASIAKLIESLSGIPADANTVAQKLLLQGLSVLTTADKVKQLTESGSITEEYDEPEQQEIPQVPVELNGLPENEASELAEGLNDFWQSHLQEAEQGARIAIVSNENAIATELALGLAQQLNQSGALLYISPNLTGQFSEMLEQFGIERKENPNRAKAIHYLPDTRTEWKRLLLDSSNNVRYNATVFDNAGEMQLSEEFPEWFEKLNPVDNAKPVTQVYVFTIERRKVNGEDFAGWLEQMDVVLYAGQNKELETIKNIFRETE